MPSRSVLPVILSPLVVLMSNRTPSSGAPTPLGGVNYTLLGPRDNHREVPSLHTSDWMSGGHNPNAAAGTTATNTSRAYSKFHQSCRDYMNLRRSVRTDEQFDISLNKLVSSASNVEDLTAKMQERTIDGDQAQLALLKFEAIEQSGQFFESLGYDFMIRNDNVIKAFSQPTREFTREDMTLMMRRQIESMVQTILGG